VRDDFPARLVAKLEQVRAATRGIDSLLVEAAVAGLSRRPAVPELTVREEVVLRMLADGLTNREIADELGISPHTVKDHLTSVYRRLEATNRASAITRARDLGLL
jgi:DNA-binding NarL/FixJ family response regulator